MMLSNVFLHLARGIGRFDISLSDYFRAVARFLGSPHCDRRGFSRAVCAALRLVTQKRELCDAFSKLLGFF
jgi:hypothetical protein